MSEAEKRRKSFLKTGVVDIPIRTPVCVALAFSDYCQKLGRKDVRAGVVVDGTDSSETKKLNTDILFEAIARKRLGWKLDAQLEGTQVELPPTDDDQEIQKNLGILYDAVQDIVNQNRYTLVQDKPRSGHDPRTARGT